MISFRKTVGRLLFPVLISILSLLISVKFQRQIILPPKTHNTEGQLKKRVKIEIPWKDGCMDWTKRTRPMPPKESVSGLVASMFLIPSVSENPQGRDYSVTMICQTIPSQLAHFLEPHGLDFLLLLSEGRQSLLYNQIATCLNLYSTSPVEETWVNLDGSSLTTYRYHSSTGRTRIYMAPNYNPRLPSYLQANLSLFSSENIEPTHCSAPLNYIQGTRWYTNEFLHLGILQNFDYWIKLDTDVGFLKTIPIHLLQDMHRKGAVFAHTAEFSNGGDASCSMGILPAIQAFLNATTTNFSWNRTMCSRGVPALEVGMDLYYTNFVIGSVTFWQSPPVLELGRWLSEYQPGFFKYRWGDQIFFHYAMGLFLKNFSKYVLDYTDLRCAPLANCWESVFNTAKFENSFNRCDNGKYFIHSKGAAQSLNGVWQQTVTGAILNQSSNLLYNHTYHSDCSDN